MTVPCPHCERRLAIRYGTNGHGQVVEVDRALCPCPKARRERRECVDCGVPVRRKATKGPHPKRCPGHTERHDRRRHRERMRAYYRKDPERFRVQARRRQRRRANRPDVAAKLRKYARDRHRAEQKIRHGHLLRCPRSVVHLRDRLIYRLRENEGWGNREIADALGIGPNYVATLYQRQVRFRENQGRRQSA